MPGRYVPDRCDVIWIDFEPKKGREIGKYRPAFVLSSKRYNKQTGLVICCPVSSKVSGHVCEVKVDGLDKPSCVVTTQIHTLSWVDRKAKLLKKQKPKVMQDVLVRVLPLIGAEKIL